MMQIKVPQVLFTYFIFNCEVNTFLFETYKEYASVEFINVMAFVQGFQSNHFHQTDCTYD